MGQRAVGVGAGQQHQDVGPGGEGAPGLDPVDHPAAVDRRGRRDDPGHVRAVVGLRHGDRGQNLGRGQLGQPLLLLLLGAAVDQGPGQDLGPGDERAADAERAPAQLLGGDDHAHVVALAAGGEAAVLLGDREPEAAELGQALDHLLGDVPFSRCTCSACGRTLSSAKRWNVSRTSSKSSPRCRGPSTEARAASTAGIALRRQEGGRRRVPARLDAPERLPADHAAREVGHDVGDERRGDAGLDLPAARRTRGRPAPRPPPPPRAPRRTRPPGWRRCHPVRAPRRRPGPPGVGPDRPRQRRRRGRER